MTFDELQTKMISCGNGQMMPVETEKIVSFIKASEDTFILKRLLLCNYNLFTLPILERLLELSTDEAQVLLAISLLHFNDGDDDKALSYLLRAKSLEPYNIDVLRTEIFIFCGLDQAEIPDLCSNALLFYPDDDWILDAQLRSKKGTLCGNISLPTLPIYRSCA